MHVTSRASQWVMLLPLGMMSLSLGCKDSTTKVSQYDDLPTGTVTAFDVTLDENATPEQVAYVLFRAVRDDLTASRAHDDDARKKSMELQASLAAADWLYTQQKQAMDREFMPVEITSKRAVYNVTRLWAPLLAHYADSFPADPETATQEMPVVYGPGKESAFVYCDVHSGLDDLKATVLFEMLLENKVWRIRRISYAPHTAAQMRNPIQFHQQIPAAPPIAS